ncbi:hypothetical protein AKJ43_02540 [candidate division MSBL1 archaeon SCGC-AAA261D19]|uniref:DUF2119 domain-containing protein n=1 Tax=candidate division MSBL1 archaeon SCGC-AAA261D19 TaxID=1698273 RepID=A0A133V6I7_9EURY|nr:hypothetical protein AKJ43_02540 [candidate division MSBL1 archaeon SCGC-AAA261D19]
MHKSVGEGRPIRLFVGGLHGKEYETTELILRDFYDRIYGEDLEGRIILRSFRTEEGEYVSTLNEGFYETPVGKELLSLIHRYRPSIYLELHSYSDYSGLTHPERMKRDGVPPLVDLGMGILAASVSPILRLQFRKEDFCFLLEVPEGNKRNGEVLGIMEIIARGSNRWEIIRELRAKYPEEVKQMIRNYLEFYGLGGPATD